MRIAAAVLTVVLVTPAAAGPFDVSPDRYGDRVNPALSEAGSDLRVRRTACQAGERPACRFAARRVDIEVAGSRGSRGTERIALAARFRRGAETEAAGLLRDAFTVLGATMVAYDPEMAADRRGEVLQTLGDAALGAGEGQEDGQAARYAVSFDDVSGRLEIDVFPLRP